MTAGDAKLAGRATDAAVNGARVPVPAGYVPPSPERNAAMQQDQAAQQRTLRDNAGFSEFFNSRGITDEMRQKAATPKWNDKPIGHDKPGIWNMRDVANIQDGGSQIYKTVDKDGKVSYIGTGSQSRYEGEQARANNPAVKREAMMTGLRNAAMTGDKNAMEMYTAHLQATAHENAARFAASAKAAGSSKDGKDTWLDKALDDSKGMFAAPKYDAKGKQVGKEFSEGDAAAFRQFVSESIERKVEAARQAGKPLPDISAASAADQKALLADWLTQYKELQAVNAATAAKNGAPLRGPVTRGARRDITLGDKMSGAPVGWMDTMFTDGHEVTDAYGGKTIVPAGALDEDPLAYESLRHSYR
jgi:hypothetical protein